MFVTFLPVILSDLCAAFGVINDDDDDKLLVTSRSLMINLLDD